MPDIIVRFDEEGEITVYVSPDIPEDTTITVVTEHYADDGEPEIVLEHPNYVKVMDNDADLADADTVLDALVGEFQGNHPTARIVDTTASGGLLLDHLEPPVHVFIGDEVGLTKEHVEGPGKYMGWFTVTAIDYDGDALKIDVKGETHSIRSQRVRRVKSK